MGYERKEGNIDNLYEKKEQRRFLRTNGTPAEAVLWTRLKRSQLAGFRFRRQYSVGPYILDFYCPAARLCVELDGNPHYTPEGADWDWRRTEFLATMDIAVIRFENKLVFENIEGVLREIKAVAMERVVT